MDQDELEGMLIRHEGLRLKPYKDSYGNVTIGVGRNLDGKGISEDEAKFMLVNDLDECLADLKDIFQGQFGLLPDSIQRVLMDMRFQLGYNGFRGFKRMIRALKGNNLPEMIAQMENSAWYRQVPGRANELIGMIEKFL